MPFGVEIPAKSYAQIYICEIQVPIHISEQEELIEKHLHITPYPNFSVDAPCNLAFRKSEGFTTRTHLILKQVEAFVHISLDLYAFIAITASAPTLDGLIDMVQADNDRRQEELDEVGEAPERALNVNTRLIDIVL